jgi:hypothetical protein
MSSQKLQSEKRFYVLIGDIKMCDTILHIIHSYRIMDAHIEYNISFNMEEIDTQEFGTFCHIDTEPNIQNMFSLVSSKGLRYIGYINGNDYILGLNVHGYIGIPIQTSKIIVSDGMQEIYYPHISLIDLMESSNFNKYRGLIGSQIKYSISEPVKTKNTCTHSVLIDGKDYHVTRIVLNGENQFIAKKEMEGIRGFTYEERIGYPVIM